MSSIRSFITICRYRVLETFGIIRILGAASWCRALFVRKLHLKDCKSIATKKILNICAKN